MAKEITNTIRLGIFVTIGVALFTIAIYYIGSRQNLFGKIFHISTYINNANGLQVGNNVRYSGITVGSVERIIFQNDSTLKVDMKLDEEVKNFIKKDAVASIGTDGLVGNVLVNISPGLGNMPPVEEGDIITSFTRTDPNDLLKTLGNTNENIALLSLNLLEIAEKINEGDGTVSRLLGDSQMAEDIAFSVSNLRTVTNNFVQMSEQLQLSIDNISAENGTLGYLLHNNTLPEKMEALATRMDSLIIEETKPIIANLKTSAEDIASSTTQLESALKTMNEGEGLATTVLRDTSAAQDMKEILKNLNEGTAGFNENMEALKHNFLFKKYFKKQEKEKRKKKD